MSSQSAFIIIESFMRPIVLDYKNDFFQKKKFSTGLSLYRLSIEVDVMTNFANLPEKNP